MEKVKILHFWPCRKSKWVISYQNEKTPLQIFYMSNSIWQTIRKLIESWKNIGGKSTHFCLGPKTGNGHRDPCFALRSKIHVLRRTISWEVLILAPNRNCTRKVYAMIWPFLEINSLNVSFKGTLLCKDWFLDYRNSALALSFFSILTDVSYTSRKTTLCIELRPI